MTYKRTDEAKIMSLMAPQAGENIQTNDPKHTIISSILTDPIFRINHEKKSSIVGTIIKQAKLRLSNAY